MSHPPPRCPVCGSDRVVPVGYDEPTQEADACEGEPDRTLGDGSPRWLCRNCGEQFGEPRDEALA
nr:MAG: hypothetical protein DIU78_17640 [Pseudomonadota bacterium]